MYFKLNLLPIFLALWASSLSAQSADLFSSLIPTNSITDQIQYHQFNQKSDNYSGLKARLVPSRQVELDWSFYVPKEHGGVVAYSFLYTSDNDKQLKVIYRVEDEKIKQLNYLMDMSFTHEKVNAGENYYQVQIEFADGTVSYSNPQIIKLE